MSKKATLVLSDMHYGDGAQLHETLSECMKRAIERVNNFYPNEIEVIVNGDAVAGRGIFRNQETQNIVQLGPEQVAWCAWEIRNWDKRLAYSKKRWVIILGNHDHSKKENLAQQLVFMLRLMNVNAVYKQRAYIGSFATEPREDMYFQAEHGFGVSSYYANSYAEIRSVWQKFIEHAKVDDVHISRFLRAHSHWLNIGQAVGLDVAIDTTGGWHRQERMTLSTAMRQTGMLLYLWNGNLQIETIKADQDLLVKETHDPGLHYKNLEAAGQALQEVIAWGKEQGLW